MSVICWDGKTLAADKRMSTACVGTTVTKIFRVRDGICGIAGDGSQGMDMIDWYERGCVPAEFPVAQRDKEQFVNFLVIRREGSSIALWMWERSPQAIRIEDAEYAMGHGRDFALAAMHLGENAREAVRVACRFDVTCGNGIDTLTLEEA